MPTTKKHTANQKKRKKRLTPVVVVTHSFFPVEENPMPEKLKKAQEILSKTRFLDS
jgi:hypothetical protein